MLNPCALTSIMFMYATSKMPKPPTAHTEPVEPSPDMASPGPWPDTLPASLEALNSIAHELEHEL